jgi:hypothetical protein
MRKLAAAVRGGRSGWVQGLLLDLTFTLHSIFRTRRKKMMNLVLDSQTDYPSEKRNGI